MAPHFRTILGSQPREANPKMTTTDHTPAHSLPVYRAGAFVVSEGTNLGDALSTADDLLLDDVYALARDAQPERLAVQSTRETHFRVAADSALGTADAALHVDCALTLMSPDGQTTDAIVLVEVETNRSLAAVYLVPLAALASGVRYTLVGIDRDGARDKLAQMTLARFARGTHITLATGAQRRIEDLVVGDRILTRNDGAQPVRWIGMSTVRAVGNFAPIRIRAGTLNNCNDLILSAHHRLFVHQRQDRLGVGRADLMVRVRHLVNGDSVVVEQGGFVDYFELLFDTHQIIYAEGIAAESTLADPRSLPAQSNPWHKRFRQTAGTNLSDLDVAETVLDRPDAADLLRRASTAR